MLCFRNPFANLHLNYSKKHFSVARLFQELLSTFIAVLFGCSKQRKPVVRLFLFLLFSTPLFVSLLFAYNSTTAFALIIFCTTNLFSLIHFIFHSYGSFSFLFHNPYLFLFIHCMLAHPPYSIILPDHRIIAEINTSIP